VDDLLASHRMATRDQLERVARRGLSPLPQPIAEVVTDLVGPFARRSHAAKAGRGSGVFRRRLAPEGVTLRLVTSLTDLGLTDNDLALASRL
jgi:hypothetical protein